MNTKEPLSPNAPAYFHKRRRLEDQLAAAHPDGTVYLTHTATGHVSVCDPEIAANSLMLGNTRESTPEEVATYRKVQTLRAGQLRNADLIAAENNGHQLKTGVRVKG